MSKGTESTLTDLVPLDGVKVIEQEAGENWALYRGDSCQVIKGIPDDSVGLQVYSPPFEGLYIYSDSVADMGNSTYEEFWQQYDYLIPELYRVTIPGRLSVVHCKDLPLYFGRDGATGLRDFPGDIIRHYSDAGWTFHSRVTIWKDPVLERARTNNNGLLNATVCRDSSQVRQGMADYLLVFRKVPPDSLVSAEPIARAVPPDGFNGSLKQYRMTHSFDRYVGSKEPVTMGQARAGEPAGGPGSKDYGVLVWQIYASPVWFDVQQPNVLQTSPAKADKDGHHICPLQLDVIERCVHLWSAPGDVVLSPFAGIGSEGYVSLLQGRRFIGMELKDSYFSTACDNLRIAAEEAKHNANLLF